MTNLVVTPYDVLDFWWLAGAAKWFAGDDQFDQKITGKFANALEEAKAGKLDDWSGSPHECLALILLLDQFSRNIFRNDSRAFEADPKALQLAGQAIEKGFDRAFPVQGRGFFYLPFEHAECMEAQEKSVDLFQVMGDQNAYHYALIHMDVIRRFGRFPHRNAVLGRVSTPDEERYLASGGFSA